MNKMITENDEIKEAVKDVSKEFKDAINEIKR